MWLQFGLNAIYEIYYKSFLKMEGKTEKLRKYSLSLCDIFIKLHTFKIVYFPCFCPANYIDGQPITNIQRLIHNN